MKEIDITKNYNGSNLSSSSPGCRKSPKRRAVSCSSLQKKAVAYQKKNSG